MLARLKITNISITAVAKGNIVATVKKLWQGTEIFRIMFHTEPAGLLIPIPQTEEELVKVCRAIRDASNIQVASKTGVTPILDGIEASV